MEEKDFLHEICITTLFASKAVKFVAVIDINGKLIVGAHKKGFHYILKRYCVTDRYHGSYHFFLNYLIPIVNKRRYSVDDAIAVDEIHFDLIDIDNNMKLAVTPLKENNEMYLCIYLESSAPRQEIISKLSSAI